MPERVPAMAPRPRPPPRAMVHGMIRLDAHGLGLEGHVDAEVGADLVAEHAPDAVRFLRGEHWEPAEAVRHLAPLEDVHRTHRQAEATRLAHVLADDHVPLAGRAAGGLLLRLE